MDIFDFLMYNMSRRLRARRGAAAPRVAFLRKKLRKNLFGKGFLPPNGMGANIGLPFLRGLAQYLPKAKTVSGCVSLVHPFIFGRDHARMFGETFKLGFIGEFGKR